MGSASTTFPKAHRGKFTPPSGTSNIKWLHVEHVNAQAVFDVTGCFNGTTDTHRRFLHGVPTRHFICYGQVASSASAFGLAQSGTVTPATVKIQFDSWTFRKTWPLRPVTNSAEAEFLARRPVCLFSGHGVATGADGPRVNQQTLSTLSLVINGMGTISVGSGEFAVDSDHTTVAIREGGGVDVTIAGRYSGGPSYTGTAFDWLFDDPDEPVKGNASLDTNGQTITHSVLVYDVTFRNPTKTGGPIPVTAHMVFDKA